MGCVLYCITFDIGEVGGVCGVCEVYSYFYILGIDKIIANNSINLCHRLATLWTIFMSLYVYLGVYSLAV